MDEHVEILDDEWERVGYLTRRRRKPGLFWPIFMVINVIAVIIMLGVMIWAFFDIGNRLPVLLAAEIPPILMLAIRRIFRD